METIGTSMYHGPKPCTPKSDSEPEDGNLVFNTEYCAMTDSAYAITSMCGASK